MKTIDNSDNIGHSLYSLRKKPNKERNKGRKRKKNCFIMQIKSISAIFFFPLIIVINPCFFFYYSNLKQEISFLFVFSKDVFFGRENNRKLIYMKRKIKEKMDLPASGTVYMNQNTTMYRNLCEKNG